MKVYQVIQRWKYRCCIPWDESYHLGLKENEINIIWNVISTRFASTILSFASTFALESRWGKNKNVTPSDHWITSSNTRPIKKKFFFLIVHIMWWKKKFAVAYSISNRIIMKRPKLFIISKIVIYDKSSERAHLSAHGLGNPKGT